MLKANLQMEKQNKHYAILYLILAVICVLFSLNH